MTNSLNRLKSNRQKLFPIPKACDSQNTAIQCGCIKQFAFHPPFYTFGKIIIFHLNKRDTMWSGLFMLKFQSKSALLEYFFFRVAKKVVTFLFFM